LPKYFVAGDFENPHLFRINSGFQNSRVLSLDKIQLFKRVPMPKKILIVEDEPTIGANLSWALGREGFTVTLAATGAEAMETFWKELHDLLILDIGLPDSSGFEVCREIRKSSAVPILFLTARTEEIDRLLSFELGGDDFVPKPFSVREVVARVRAILRRAESRSGGERGMPPLPFQFDHEKLKLSFHGSRLELSRYEYRLLRVLASSPGRVFTREQLMALCWEEPEMSLERTVDAHVKSIRAKLRGIKPGEEWIVTHRGTGYSLRELSPEEDR
jgi:two-component system catabolic regulation response regulator CreB